MELVDRDNSLWLLQTGSSLPGPTHTGRTRPGGSDWATESAQAGEGRGNRAEPTDQAHVGRSRTVTFTSAFACHWALCRCSVGPASKPVAAQQATLALGLVNVCSFAEGFLVFLCLDYDFFCNITCCIWGIGDRLLYMSKPKHGSTIRGS